MSTSAPKMSRKVHAERASSVVDWVAEIFDESLPESRSRLASLLFAIYEVLRKNGVNNIKDSRISAKDRAMFSKMTLSEVLECLPQNQRAGFSDFMLPMAAVERGQSTPASLDSPMREQVAADRSEEEMAKAWGFQGRDAMLKEAVDHYRQCMELAQTGLVIVAFKPETRKITYLKTPPGLERARQVDHLDESQKTA